MTQIRAKRRRPTVAALLSILLPGLGHLYSGRPLLFAVFVGLTVVIYLVAALSTRLLVLLYAAQARHLIVGLVAVGIVLLSFPVVAAWRSVTAARKAETMRLRWYNRRYVYVIVIGVVNVLVFPPLLDALPLRPFRNSSDSMAPALQSGDRIMAATYYRSPRPERGDIVVFRQPGGSRLDVKRVVGLSGETLTLRRDAVLVDGRAGTDSWGWYQQPSPFLDGSQVVVAVPDDAVFLVGDNRFNSFDSRNFGPVPLKLLVGKALTIYSSPDRTRIGTRVE